MQKEQNREDLETKKNKRIKLPLRFFALSLFYFLSWPPSYHILTFLYCFSLPHCSLFLTIFLSQFLFLLCKIFFVSTFLIYSFSHISLFLIILISLVLSILCHFHPPSLSSCSFIDGELNQITYPT